MSHAARTETCAWSWPSRRSSVGEAVDAVLALVRRHADRAGEHAAMLDAVALAVGEAVANAVIHGHRLIADKAVAVAATANDAGIEIVVCDHGDGFDPARVPDPTTPDGVKKPSGRGCLLLRHAMDRVEWRVSHGGGTSVWMARAWRRPA